MPFSAIDALHAQPPLRVWSVIVTIFGDAVMRAGTLTEPAPVWTGALIQLLGLLGIEAGLARTSLSRLTANGILVRERAGRNTFYRLGSQANGEFAEAADLIYGRRQREPTGRFHVVLIDRCADRNTARQRLTEAGFRFIGPSSAIAPEHGHQEAPNLPDGAIAAMANCSDELVAAAREVWSIAALDAGYRQFLSNFTGLAAVGVLAPADAIVARIALVHRYRRLALRDPTLPDAALPEDWSGHNARTMFVTKLASLDAAAERWLSETAFRTTKPFDVPA